jgi:hypothetical protein
MGKPKKYISVAVIFMELTALGSFEYPQDLV